jgi:hypothetical protein
MRFKPPTFLIDCDDGSFNMEWCCDEGRFALYIDVDPKDSCWTFVTKENIGGDRNCGDLATLTSPEVFSMLKKIGALVSEDDDNT